MTSPSSKAFLLSSSLKNRFFQIKKCFQIKINFKNDQIEPKFHRKREKHWTYAIATAKSAAKTKMNDLFMLRVRVNWFHQSWDPSNSFSRRRLSAFIRVKLLKKIEQTPPHANNVCLLFFWINNFLISNIPINKH